MPFIIKDNIDFIQKGKKYCLILNSGFFGSPTRFGDFVMASNLMYILKHELINKFSYLTYENMFFIFNIKNKILISNFENIFKMYSNLYLPEKLNNSQFMNNNVNQILNGINMQQYKCYLDNINYHLKNTVRPLAKLNDFVAKEKKYTYILPTFGKHYNLERNWTNSNFHKIMKKAELYKHDIKLIVKDNYNVPKKWITDLNLNVNVELIKSESWEDIIKGVMTECLLYIGGDCGFTHFVCSLHNKYRPKRIICYYNTNGLNVNPNTVKKVVKYPNKVEKYVQFKPWTLFEGANINILPF